MLDYKVDDKYIIFDETHKKRIKDPSVVISKEEVPFSMLDDKSYIAKMAWKRAAVKVIIRI
jgi:hypothetical protein